MNKAEIEQREEALKRSNYLCPVCGKPINQGQPQYAHKIANKEMWRKKYGTFIIDHTLNGEYVCSLGCNHSVDTGSGYGAHLDVIADILISEYTKTWGAKGLNMLTDKILEKYKKLGVKID